MSGQFVIDRKDRGTSMGGYEPEPETGCIDQGWANLNSLSEWVRDGYEMPHIWNPVTDRQNSRLHLEAHGDYRSCDDLYHLFVHNPQALITREEIWLTPLMQERVLLSWAPLIQILVTQDAPPILTKPELPTPSFLYCTSHKP